MHISRAAPTWDPEQAIPAEKYPLHDLMISAHSKIMAHINAHRNSSGNRVQTHEIAKKSTSHQMVQDFLLNGPG